MFDTITITLLAFAVAAFHNAGSVLPYDRLETISVSRQPNLTGLDRGSKDTECPKTINVLGRVSYDQ